MIRSLARGAVALTGICLLVATAGTASAEASAAPGWRLTTVFGTGAQNYDPVWPGGLAVPARNSAWMIWEGCTWPCSSGDNVSAVEHWNGRSWAAVPAADLQGITPYEVAASSAADAWIFGQFGSAGTQGALHYDGSTWVKRAIPSWVIRGNLAGETDIYPADFGASGLWVFSLGTTSMGKTTAFAARYRDGRWTKSDLPETPNAASAVSARDIWAVGSTGTAAKRATLMHWNGRSWKTTSTSAQPSRGYAGELVATGPESLWLTWYPANVSKPDYLLHWNGSSWVKVSLPAGDGTGPIAGDGHGGIWMAGSGPAPKAPWRFLHYAAGRWTTDKVPLAVGAQPGNVSELALIPGTDSLWGVGHFFGRGGGGWQNRTGIWRYNP